MSTWAEPFHFNAWIAFATLLRREVMRYLKLAAQTIGAPFLSNVLFLAVFGGLLSSRPSGIPGVPYVRFLVPGLVVMGALLSAFQNPLFSLIAMKYQNTLHDLGQYPLTATARFAAFALAGALRGLLVGTMTFAAAGLFVGFALAQPALFWLYLAALCLVAASAGIACGLYFDSFEQANVIVSLVVSPALFLGGVFFQPEAASRWLALIARYNPLTFLVGQGRRLYLGTGVLESPLTVLLAAAVCVVAVTLAVRTVASGRGMKIA
jgi:ABC-2 type transport system permease protein